jgi:glutathione S-transferase
MQEAFAGSLLRFDSWFISRICREFKMADYDLYYWPVPFRGQFIRAILAFAGKSWAEHDAQDIGDLMATDPADQPMPFTGPPMLIENATRFALAQTPAIVLYLGQTLQLIPNSAQATALTVKIVNDANDVLDETTLNGGREMWTRQKWEEYQPRLRHWMTLWEVTAVRHGVTANAGFMLGTPQAGIADIVTGTLWSTMADRFPTIAAMLDETAPSIAGLSRRMQALPALAALSRLAFQQYGDDWCGGEIEKSLRACL